MSIMCAVYVPEGIVYLYSVNSSGYSRLNYSRETEDIIYGVGWHGQQDAITRLINGQPPTVINFQMMPLKDAIDFSEFLIDLTIKYERFKDDIQTCGGSIDILVLTKDSGFWYKHKIRCKIGKNIF